MSTALAKRAFAGASCWLVLVVAVWLLAEAARRSGDADAHEHKQSFAVAPAAQLAAPRPPASNEPREPASLGTGARPVARVEPAQASAQGPERQPDPALARGSGAEEVLPGLGPLPPGVPPEEEGVGITCVRPDGSHVVGAVLRWATSQDLARLVAEDPRVLDLDDDLVLGRLPHNQVRTTSNGWGMVPSLKGSMIVDARFGDGYASRRFERSDVSHLKLVLHRDLTLVVEVCDEAGAPIAGMPVAVRDAQGREPWRATTGADGRALLPHAPERFATLAGKPDLWAIVDAPQDSRAQLLQRSSVPQVPVRLVARRGMALEVEAASGAGACPDGGRVAVVRAGSEPEGVRTTTRTLVGGKARFEHAAPGAGVVVVADPGCGALETRAPWDLPLEAPASGACAFRLQVGAPMPVLEASVSDIDGRKLEGWTASLHLQGPMGWSEEGRASVGPGGSVRVPAPGFATGDEVAARALVVRNEHGASKVLEFGDLSSKIDKSGALRVVRVGAVQLVNWTIQFGGRVLDEAGRPVEGARVALVSSAGGVDSRIAGATNGEGRFDLRGPKLPGAHELSVSHPARAGTTSIPAKAGDKSLVAQLAFLGSIEGRVLPHEGVLPQQYTVVLVDALGVAVAASPDDQGAWRFERVEPGAAVVQLQLGGFPDILASSRPVQVVAGEKRQVEAFASEGLLRRVSLEIVDDAGSPVETGVVGPPAPGRGRVRPFEFRDGQLVLHLPLSVRELEAEAEGHESVRQTVSASMRFVLKKLPQ